MTLKTVHFIKIKIELLFNALEKIMNTGEALTIELKERTMKKLMMHLLIVLILGILISCAQEKSTKNYSDWQTVLNQRLPEYGHRNWIVIADAAYPKQSSSGIETVSTNTSQIKVLKHVLNKIDETNHIQPIVMLDKELQLVSEKNAPGIQEYRTALSDILGNRSFKEMPHETIIKKLDEGSKLFNVLLLKTNLAIPYTSVFIELDCGYWNAQKENELRTLIKDVK